MCSYEPEDCIEKKRQNTVICMYVCVYVIKNMKEKKNETEQNVYAQ